MSLVRQSQAVADQGAVCTAVPLERSPGPVLSTLCVVDAEPREWTEAEQEAVQESAALATSEIEYGLRRPVSGVGTLARQLEEPVELLGDAVRSFASVADQLSLSPRVGRLAALAQSRFAAVESLARELSEMPDVRRRSARADAGTFDLGERLERTVRLATVSAQLGDVRLEFRDPPVLAGYDCDLLERAVSHMVVTVLHHASEAQSVEVTVTRRDDDAAGVEIRSPGGSMAASELAAIVSRMSQAMSTDHATASQSSAGAGSIFLSGRTTIAQGEGVRGTTGPEGTYVTMRFDLQAGL